MNEASIWRSGEDVAELKVRDCTGRIVDKFNFKVTDEEEFNRVITILKNKYNLGNKRNINWLGGDMGW